METGLEPHNVQEKTEGGMAIGHRDESGVFFEAHPDRIEDRSKAGRERERVRWLKRQCT